MLAAAAVPLARLARQSLDSSGGSVPVWLSLSFGVVGVILAWRRPRNPLSWIILVLALCLAASEDASFYTVADYGLRHGGLPLGWLALLVQPAWAPGIMLLGLVVLLFPDGLLPSPRWRQVLWVYVAIGLVWTVGAFVVTVGAIIEHRTRVDSSGNLLLLTGNDPAVGWWNVVQAMFIPVLVACWLAAVLSQVLAYRRSAGERRQQVKWLMAGSAIMGAGLVAATELPKSSVVDLVSQAAFLALPVCLGVAVLRYRLFDIDRIISRTLAYAIVTGVLVAADAAPVLLATRLLSFQTPIAVAGATLVAAAIFNPLRRRVQRIVDKRFNRARYDADLTVTAFAARLNDAVDLDTIRTDLAGVVQHALEPAPISLWVNQRL